MNIMAGLGAILVIITMWLLYLAGLALGIWIVYHILIWLGVL